MSADLSSTIPSSPGTYGGPLDVSAYAATSTAASDSSGQPTVDRRSGRSDHQGSERRQFGSSYSQLSPAAQELAQAIDQYKLEHCRRYITCEEMLAVITQLGYRRP